MILLDYNAIAVSVVVLNNIQEENLFRHTVLNSIRMYNHKYRHEYGDMVICGDGAKVWRKEYFKQYKAKRRESREKDNKDWNVIFEMINKIREEIKSNFHYKVIKIDECEADDIIATLAYETQEFGKNEPVMIVSGDKDFIQLHTLNNVKQWSPIIKKLVVHENPHNYLKEHIIKGDSGDGVPNILSGDNYLVDGIRQSPITQKKLDTYLDTSDDLKQVLYDEQYRNFQRNAKLIDLKQTPEEIKQKIIDAYDNYEKRNSSQILNYLIKNRCNQLIESIQDFY